MLISIISTDIEKDCPGIEPNVQSLETEEKYCYLDNTIEQKGLQPTML